MPTNHAPHTMAATDRVVLPTANGELEVSIEDLFAFLAAEHVIVCGPDRTRRRVPRSGFFQATIENVVQRKTN